MVEQVFLLMGEVWLMHNVDTQYTERRPKGREEFLCLNFSCFVIKYEFDFTCITKCYNFCIASLEESRETVGQLQGKQCQRVKTELGRL